MATKIDLINQSLSLLGSNLIQSEQDDSDIASLAVRNWEAAKRHVDAAVPWRFDYRENTLAAASTDKHYLLPTDTAQVVDILRNGLSMPYQLRGNQVYVPDASAADVITLSYQIESSVADWPRDYQQVMVLALAHFLGGAMAIDGQRRRQADLNHAVNRAKVNQGIAKSKRKIRYRQGYASAWRG